MLLQTPSPESKFPNEYSDVIFIQIDQHFKKLLQKYKGSRFYESRCSLRVVKRGGEGDGVSEDPKGGVRRVIPSTSIVKSVSKVSK